MFFLLATVTAWSADVSCKGCAAGKLMLQCDYYVARGGDLSKRHYCEAYAKVVNLDGASAKAAWYYLLAGRPDAAYDAAKRAMDTGQHFAALYAALAEAMAGRKEAAAQLYKRFIEWVPDHGYARDRIATLAKLYPDADFSPLGP